MASDYQQDMTKQSSVETQDIYIPIEIISNILSRLPVPTVLRFRSVCKAWSQLTRTQVFVHQHLKNFHNNETNHGTLVLGRSFQNEKTLDYCSQGNSRSVKVDYKFSMWGCKYQHCNGLVCINSIGHDLGFTIAILNPAVDDEFIKLPDDGMTKRAALDVYPCYDPHSNKYKVIRLFYCHDHADSVMGIEVLTLGDNSWRQVGKALIKLSGTENVNINGAMHWITFGDKIVSFGIRDENLVLIEYPAQEANTNTYNEYDDNLIEYEGCLCVVRCYYPPLKLKLFVMEDYVNRIWKTHEIDLKQINEMLSNFPGNYHYYPVVYTPIGSLNGKIILGNFHNTKETYYFNPKTRSIERCEVILPWMLHFKESLIPAKTILCGEA